METYEKIKEVKDRYSAVLMKKANVVGVGIGFAVHGGVRTDQLAIVVMVEHKIPRQKLQDDDIIPQEIDGIPVDVQSVGGIHALE